MTTARDPGPAQVQAFAEYEARRDALAVPLLQVTEQIAAFRWDLTEIRRLLIRLAAVMNDDLHVLSPIKDVA